VTVEEALFALVAGVAIVLLFLGLADALEGDARARLRARRRALARGLRPPPRPEAEAPRGPRPVMARRPAREAVPRETRSTVAGVEAVVAEVTPAEEPSRRETSRRMSVVETPPAPEPIEPEPPDWRDRAAALMRGREWAEARAVVEAALADGAMKPEVAEYLLDVCSIASARELWRLRRAQRRGTGDEASLQGALGMTRLLLDSPPAAELREDARSRAGRRLWRGHARIGLRRWRAGDFDVAADALFGALGTPGLDDRRRSLARDLLVRTLEDMAGQRLELIPQLLGEGDRAAAREQAQSLDAHVRRAREDGIAPEDLAVAAARARQLLEHVEHNPVE
jgi:hypothetical protein